eukprot:scaffold68144_cov73-Phaeocystis_antarctica.AAC.2
MHCASPLSFDSAIAARGARRSRETPNKPGQTSSPAQLHNSLRALDSIPPEGRVVAGQPPNETCGMFWPRALASCRLGSAASNLRGCLSPRACRS